MKKQVTIEDLNAAQCYDISIQTLPAGQDFLILICKEKEGSNKLLEILQQNAFDLKIYVDETTQQYYLQFEFIDTDIAMKLETGRTETDYPPLKKLKYNQIKFITTGVWTGQSTAGRNCEYNGQLMRLGEFDLGKSFEQAKGVQFAAGRNEKEPPVVVLIFENYDHIFRSEADEAYNKLAKMAISKPMLEITPVNSKTVNLRIWDILVDLDVKFEGLKYSDDELKEFIGKTGDNQSFAFAIGFLPSGKQMAAIASTKKEGFEIITLYGYTNIKNK